MKVVMLTTDYLDSRHGGVESHIYYLARSLIDRGHIVQVLRISTENARRPAPADVPLTFLQTHTANTVLKRIPTLPGPLGSTATLRLAQNLDARRIAKIIEPLASDAVIHQHDFLGNVRLSKLLARKHPVVWTNHLGEFLLLRGTAAGTVALKFLTSHYAQIFAPSAELANLPWARNRVTRCANGVDLQRFKLPVPGERSKLREGFGWDPHELVILVPRRWAPTKGVLIAARALNAVSKRRTVRAVFVGAGSSLYPSYATEVSQTLREFRGALEVVDEVNQEQIAEYYRACDLTLIPSFLEATSLAGLEAMASGCLVIASSVGGMPELIEDGWNGFLTPPGDHDALASAIDTAAVLGRDERDLLTTRAARHVASHYSWPVVAERVEAAYQVALSGRRRRAV